MKKFWKESINDKSFWILILLVGCMFAFGLIMHGIVVGKYGKKITYNDEIYMTIYTVFTQMSFLFLSFIICSNINKNYKEKTSLFYKSIGVNSFIYFWQKTLITFIQIIIPYTILFVLVSTYYQEFNNIFSMLFITYCVIFNVVCISSIFALIIPNLIVSIGSSILFWLATIIMSMALPNKYSFIAIFDQNFHIFKELTKNRGYLNWNSIQEIIIYMIFIIIISSGVAILNKKRWIKNGI